MPSLNLGTTVGNVDTAGLGFYKTDSGGNRIPMFGRGIDGDVTLSAGSNNINTSILGVASGSPARTVDAVATNVTAISGATLTVGASTNFRVDDIVIIMNMRGSTTRFSQVGVWEFAYVAAVGAGTVTLMSPPGKLYGQDAGLTPTNSDLTGQSVVLQRVPEYNNITLSGTATITASAFNGTTGGLVAVMCNSYTSSAAPAYVGGAVGYRGGVGADGEGLKGTTWVAGNSGGRAGGSGGSGFPFPTLWNGGVGGGGGGGGSGGGHLTAGAAGVGSGGGSGGGSASGANPVPVGPAPGTYNGLAASGASGGFAAPVSPGAIAGKAGGAPATDVGAAVSYSDVLDLGPILMGGGGGGGAGGSAGPGGPGSPPAVGTGYPGGVGGTGTGGGGGGIALMFARTTNTARFNVDSASGTAGSGTAGTVGTAKTESGGSGGGSGGGGSAGGGSGAGGSIAIVSKILSTSTMSVATAPASGGGAAGAVGPVGPATPGPPSGTDGGAGGASAAGGAGTTGGIGKSFVRFLLTGSTFASANADGVGNYAPTPAAYKATL